jgi:hypothetical protein
MVGKKLGEKLVVSLEYSRELFHDRGFYMSPTNGSSKAASDTTFE